jgi:hypothetical protein
MKRCCCRRYLRESSQHPLIHHGSRGCKSPPTRFSQSKATPSSLHLLFFNCLPCSRSATACSDLNSARDLSRVVRLEE